MEKKLEGLELLRKPFEGHQISTMCRSTKKDNPKGTCAKCGGFHGLPAVTLEYVGHAALTDRLLEVDPTWTWEPLALGPDGYPAVDKDGGMWIKLTVCGVTRIGYGDNQNRTGGDGVKERIGDALRNAAMRFGAALDLWHKGDLHGEDDEGEEGQKPPASPQQSTVTPASFISEAQAKRFYAIAKNAGHDDESIKSWLLREYKVESSRTIPRDLYDDICHRVVTLMRRDEREPGEEG